jgi:hypothetical protein
LFVYLRLSGGLPNCRRRGLFEFPFKGFSLRNWIKKISWLRRIAYGFRFWYRDNRVERNGRGNRILAEGAWLENCRIRFEGSGSVLEFEPGASVKDCEIVVLGNEHRLFVGAGAVLTQSLLWFEDRNCRISIGRGTTMQRNGHIAVTEPGRSIDIGENGMFSFSVDIRNGDSHTIFEEASGRRVNFARNIRIGNHVWLGAYTQVIGGSDIGDNSIVGIRSLVNGPIPSSAIAVGIPARAVKQGFSWDSRRWPDEEPAAGQETVS